MNLVEVSNRLAVFLGGWEEGMCHARIVRGALNVICLIRRKLF